MDPDGSVIGTALGEIIAQKEGWHFLVRLADNREIMAVLTRRVARDAFAVRVGERVRVAFWKPPRMPRIVELLRGKEI
jgi:hypothetical protein